VVLKQNNLPSCFCLLHCR